MSLVGNFDNAQEVTEMNIIVPRTDQKILRFRLERVDISSLNAWKLLSCLIIQRYQPGESENVFFMPFQRPLYMV